MHGPAKLKYNVTYDNGKEKDLIVFIREGDTEAEGVSMVARAAKEDEPELTIEDIRLINGKE